MALHSLRPTDASRTLARHRVLPARGILQALSSRHSRSRRARHFGRCQEASRLASVCRLSEVLIEMARPLYAEDPFGVKYTVDAFDATTIDEGPAYKLARCRQNAYLAGFASWEFVSASTLSFRSWA